MVGYSPSLNCNLPTIAVDCAHFLIASFIESLESLCKGKMSFLMHACEIKEWVALESINKWKVLSSYSEGIWSIAYCWFGPWCSTTAWTCAICSLSSGFACMTFAQISWFLGFIFAFPLGFSWGWAWRGGTCQFIWGGITLFPWFWLMLWLLATGMKLGLLWTGLPRFPPFLLWFTAALFDPLYPPLPWG